MTYKCYERGRERERERERERGWAIDSAMSVEGVCRSKLHTSTSFSRSPRSMSYNPYRSCIVHRVVESLRSC